MKKQGVIILSGGMDSTTLLYWLRDKKYEVEAISFDYGQRHRKELYCARDICKELGIPWQVVELNNITRLISNSALTGNIEVPHGHYQAENMKKTVVPNRNMIMLSIAIGYAENKGYGFVAIANHAGDHYIYPDCRPQFIQAINIASMEGTFNRIRVLSPFVNHTKGEIALIGLKLGIDYDKTWTCYEGKEKPCGKCGSCTEREEALQYAKVNL